MKDFSTAGPIARNYVIDEVVPPPPSPDSPQIQQTISSDATVAMVAISANFAVTIAIVVGMLWEGREVLWTLIIGSLYFGLTTPLYIAIITGAMAVIFSVWQHEITERQRIDAYERVASNVIQWRQAIEANRMLELQAQSIPVEVLQRLSALESRDQEGASSFPITANFVPAFENKDREEAIQWLGELYTDLGLPDPNMVQMVGDPDSIGRLKVRMLGSKRGGGTREAGLWLLRVGAIVKISGGYRLNLAILPRRESIRYLPK